MGFVLELEPRVLRCCRLVNECVLAVLGLRADHAQCPVDSYVLAFWLYFGAEWNSRNIGYIELPVHFQFTDADAVLPLGMLVARYISNTNLQMDRS